MAIAELVGTGDAVAAAGAGAGDVADAVAAAAQEKTVAGVMDAGKQSLLQLAAVHSLQSWENARRRRGLAVREFWRWS